MKKSLIISIIIGITLIFVAIYYVSTLNKDPASPLDKTLQAATIQALNEVGSDGDEDGLSDWEERLWGTDSTKPDTDGDGTNDGVEIKEKRDPNKAGPNDNVAPELVNTLPATATSTLFTQGSFAQAYAEIYTRLSAGESLSDSQKEELAERLIADISGNPILQEKKAITIGDLNLINLETQTEYLAYKQGFLDSIKSTSPKEPENEAELMAKAMQTKDKAAFAKIAEIGKSHESLANALIKIKTPSILALTHLEIINSLYNLSLADAGMARAETDPMTAIAALQRYVAGTQRLSSATAALSEEFKKVGLIF